MPKHAAGRQKKVLKHAKIKHAEARGKKKHAGRTASLHANDQFHLTDSLYLWLSRMHARDVFRKNFTDDL